MNTAYEVARYFLEKDEQADADDSGISNLKLQKLLYYAQGFHLALYDEPLFGESLAAWTHGPVCPDVYHQYKRFGKNNITEYQPNEPTVFDKERREFLDEVFAVFGQFSAWKLRNMTHDEPPWKNSESFAGEISHESMKEYFKTLLA